MILALQIALAALIESMTARFASGGGGGISDAIKSLLPQDDVSGKNSIRGTRASSFKTDEDLGAAVKQIEQLKAQQEYNQKQAESLTAAIEKAAQQGSSPGQLAKLAQQKGMRERMITSGQAQMKELESRVKETVNPSQPEFPKLAGLAIGTAAAAGVIGAGRAAWRGADAVMDGPEKQVIGGIAGAAARTAGAGIAGASAGATLGPAGAVAGAAIGSLVGASTELVKLPALIKEWSESLIESKRGIAQFNGTLAVAFAESERRGIVRDIRSGEQIGGNMADLMRTLDDFKDTVQPIKDSVTIVISNSLQLLVDAAKKLADRKDQAEIILNLMHAGLNEFAKYSDVARAALTAMDLSLKKLNEKKEVVTELPINTFIREGAAGHWPPRSVPKK